MSAWQNGIKSAGVRAVINGPSTTTGASIKVAPAFTKSSFIATNEVHCLSVHTGWPFGNRAEQNIQGPWQMAAQGLPSSIDVVIASSMCRFRLI